MPDNRDSTVQELHIKRDQKSERPSGSNGSPVKVDPSENPIGRPKTRTTPKVAPSKDGRASESEESGGDEKSLPDVSNPDSVPDSEQRRNHPQKKDAQKSKDESLDAAQQQPQRAPRPSILKSYENGRSYRIYEVSPTGCVLAYRNDGYAYILDPEDLNNWGERVRVVRRSGLYDQIKVLWDNEYSVH